MEHKRLKEKLEAILTLPDLPWDEDLTAQDCIRRCLNPYSSLFVIKRAISFGASTLTGVWM